MKEILGQHKLALRGGEDCFFLCSPQRTVQMSLCIMVTQGSSLADPIGTALMIVPVFANQCRLYAHP